MTNQTQQAIEHLKQTGDFYRIQAEAIAEAADKCTDEHINGHFVCYQEELFAYARSLENKRFEGTKE